MSNLAVLQAIKRCHVAHSPLLLARRLLAKDDSMYIGQKLLMSIEKSERHPLIAYHVLIRYQG